MKRVRDTSAMALHDLCADRSRRIALVVDGVAQYAQQHGDAPTAYEVLRLLQADHPWLDVNGVRPRLTELEDAGRVAKGPKRPCTVTGKLAYTWVVVSSAPVPGPVVRPLPAAPLHQLGLL